MAQAQSNVSYLDNECIYCTDLMWNTIKWLDLTDSTLNLYNRLKEEVELFEGRPLCLTCEDIIKRKIKILKRIDPSLENVFNAIKYNHQIFNQND